MANHTTLTHNVILREDQRQLIILALVELCESRPGWLFAAREAAETMLGGGAMFDSFREIEPNFVMQSLGKIK